MINIYVTLKCSGDIFHPTNNYAFVNPDTDTNPDLLPIITLNGNYKLSYAKAIFDFYVRKQNA